MATKTIKILLSVAFLGACVPIVGCDEHDWEQYACCGDYSWTDVGVGVGSWPGYTVVEDYTPAYYPETYVDTGGYYYDDSYGGYYGDYYGDCPDCAYKTKLSGRSK
ncbi:MAG TPA: hypothetical protein VMV94_14225 [Phycisphaerae bacterium]|nr:hypothetical protein [Phycisphaerae bacterium]